MEERVPVPCVGGPLDGRDLSVPVDEDGYPPELVNETWLWTEYGSELYAFDTSGRYEREPIAGAGPPWQYVWVPNVWWRVRWQDTT